MQCRPSAMTYTVLRGVRNNAQGFVRMEPLPEGIAVSVHAEGVPAGTPLRLLLLSEGEEGAALDLGPADVAADGTTTLTRKYPAIALHLWDAAALVEDWPSGRLVAAGWLRKPTGPAWRLADAAARFLRVPAE